KCSYNFKMTIFNYIFGEFSPDEINQFFVTPRCYVEVRTMTDSGSYCTPAVPYIMESMGLQVCAEDYQRIEFGVDEVMDSKPIGVNDPLYKVSSTLNPQAPEFILGCQSVQKAPQTTLPAPDVPDGSHFNSLDGPDSEASALDNHQVCQDMDAPGSLGQRERKKKKKRPPGYYNYLDPLGGGNGSGSIVADGQSVTTLVNGHVLGGPHNSTEDVDSKAFLGNELSTPGPVSLLTSTNVVFAPTTTANQRTCDSPDDSSLDLTSTTASLSDGNNATSSSSSSSSQSRGMTEGPRTADQQQDHLASGSPELLVSPHSPRSKSPLPPSESVAAPSDITSITTTELERREEADSGVTNGLEQTSMPVSTGGLKEDCEIVEQSQHLAPDSNAQPVVSEQAQLPAVSVAPTANLPKSWASLFHNSKPLPGGPPAFVEVKHVVDVVSPSPAVPEEPEQVEEVKEGPIHVSEDPFAPKLAEIIENVKLMHKPVSLQPRGLINKGNWCYINATLQALIACPPMYHLMKSITLHNETQRTCTSTPMIDNFVRLVNEFSNMPVPSKTKQQAAGEKVTKDIRPGVPFEPTYIYRLLTLIKSSLSEKGRQEDAEEYLGFTLNGLHEEMLALKKLISPQEETPTPNGPESQPGVEEDLPDKEEEESDDEWEQVGPRNKISITRQADFVRTPITDIFGGHTRSVVYQQNSKESATLQPFFTLQLDIQSEKIRTVQEALETLVARESVQGYTSKTKQEIEISRRVTLEELPPVLVLHLKRFVFEKTGGCQKLTKNVDYPVDLEISKDLLSSGVRSKILKGQRTYRLFAVVYHHGNSATGGHYTTDVFHIGLNGWLRIDDQTVKIINQYQVVKQTAERTAYLLYYRRVDLL
uniref:Ubiquitin carboxyl-terminal hydrolase n=1 Tax=Oryzias sinensis TaxID=183150 RepID=A0A8C7X2J0_9TELE